MKDWSLILPDAERIVRKVALSGDARIRATAQFEQGFYFPKPEQLDLVKGFLISRKWASLEIQWLELIRLGRDYMAYPPPDLPKASREDVRAAVAAIIDERGYCPNDNELPPLVNEKLKGRGKKASWSLVQEVRREPPFSKSIRARGVTEASQARKEGKPD
jgi:hypothetical protein